CGDQNMSPAGCWVQEEASRPSAGRPRFLGLVPGTDSPILASPMVPKQLGSYEIIEKIGAGGMGEGYRAHDSRLARDVALKILPEIFAQDADRLARFEREARLLAALNHPGIGAIYGLEQAEGLRFLVLELVPGEDLAARIARGAIPLDEALPIARDIAEAVEF